MSRRLKEYEKRRDFDRTTEPRPSNGGSSQEHDPVFVIHEHDARQHHFDLRLEMDGVLASWVVPKGPSTDPSDRRLALRMEDHPVDYADFEGVIPEGEYGAGPVSVWDRGTFENVTEKDGDEVPAADALENGHLVVRLAGEKLQGGFALQRTPSLEDDDGEKWLLVKTDDDGADARRKPARTEPDSVASGRTLDEIAEEEGDD